MDRFIANSGSRQRLLMLWTLLSVPVFGQDPTKAASSAIVTPHVEISTTIPLWTDFDLFKNTGFTPCLINSNKSADPTTKDFIVSREVSTQDEFCSFMAGTPIMIPTVPNRVAFFPWYPTMLVQAISLSVSYVGLFFLLRRVDHSRNSGHTYKNPWWYWLLMAIDLARNVAFAFEVAHGFSDPTHFAWVSVLFWLLPLNYVFVSTQMRAVKQSARLFAAAAATYEEPYTGTATQIRQHLQLRASQLLGRTPTTTLRVGGRPRSDSDAITPIASNVEQKREQASLRFTASSAGFPSLASIAGDFASANKRRTAPRGTTVWSWIITTVISWFMTFIVTILHWKWSFPHPMPPSSGAPGAAGAATSAASTISNSTNPMTGGQGQSQGQGQPPAIPSLALASALYSQITTSVTKPQSIGNMPVSCLSYLSTGNLLLAEGGSFFARPSEDLPNFSILETLQFVLATLTAIIAVYMLFIRRGSRHMHPQFVSTSPYAAAAFAHDEQLAQASSSARTKTLLLLSAGMTMFFLVVPAFAMGMDIVARVDKGGARVGLRFTNDLSLTGGCTFAFVDMDKRAGYWDVATGLGERVIMSLLGVA